MLYEVITSTFNVYLAFFHVTFDDFKYKIFVFHIFGNFKFYNFALVVRIKYFFFHHPFANSRHLRAAVGIDNGSNNISTKSRTNLV